MKNNKSFLFMVLSALTMSLVMGCSSNSSSPTQESKEEPISISSVPEEDEEPEPLEIGDTVKEWVDDSEYFEVPMAVPSSSNNGTGEIKITNDNGYDDNISLKFEGKAGNNSEGYITSETISPYFLEEDAKNGDIISLYYFVPTNGNVASLQIQVLPSSMNNPISGKEVEINEQTQNKWARTLVYFDTLETFGAIRLIYKAVDPDKAVTFYVDNINIEYGAETVKTDYVSNGESLKDAFEDYFKIGTCLPSNGLRNTETRKIAIENFNSITAENEAKPEQILDQEACQEALKNDKTAVKITTAPFEKIYSFAEANHMLVRHHTFVWYSQTPAWFFTEDYTQGGAAASRDTMLKRMNNFIKVTMDTINAKWPGLVYAIDVVNEAVGNGGAGYNKNNKWFDTVGEDFVYQAFKFASMYKEDYQDLYYNDYDYDYNTSNCEFALNTILKKAIEEDLVDGVGIQGHIDSDQNMDVILTDAKMIKEKGLKCQITELDITVNGSDDAAWAKQKGAYKLLVKRILEANELGETDINAFIVWGITDNSSWKRNQNPLLFTSNYGKKPAYYGCLEALEEFEEEYYY